MDLALAGTRAIVFGADGALRDTIRAMLSDEGVAFVDGPADDCTIAVAVLPSLAEGPLSGLDGGAALIDAWHEVEAVVTLFRAALPAMENARYGRLILVGPIEIKTMTGRDAALDRTIGLGLLGMMKALSGEVGPEAITCNSVLVDLDPADPSERDTLIGSAAATVAYLASPHASFLTGLVIGVDRARSGSIF